MRRGLLTALLVMAALLGVAQSASAHAVLVESTPARGAELRSAPPKVEFEFNEPIEASLGAVRVFDTEGTEVQEGELLRPGGDAHAVGVRLRPDLPDGLYTATYHVVSADAHPVSGGITFTVGQPGEGAAGFVQGKTISQLLAENETGTVTEVAFWADRWLGYLAIALAVGVLAWLLLAPAGVAGGPGGPAVVSRLRPLLLASAGAGVAASLLAVVFQGAVGAGTSFWHALGSGIPGEVIDTRFGTVMLVRIGAWLAIGALALSAAPRLARPGPASILGLAVALVLAATPAFAGHASTRDPTWLLVPSDIAHVTAMAVWSGGLAAMLWLLPAATRAAGSAGERTGLLTDVTLRFSAVALTCVAVIGASGAIQAILDVGSVPDLFETQFGRAVSIKIVLFAVLIGLGAANRVRIVPGLVRRLEASGSPGGPGLRLRRSLRAETALVVVVLGVTAALVSYPPPDAIQAGPASGSVVVEGNRVEYTVDPAKVGGNEVHIYVFDDRTGAPVPVRGMDLSFSLPDAGIAPIEVDARRAGPGHFVVPRAALGVKGEWRADAAIRLSEFDEPIAEFEVKIR